MAGNNKIESSNQTAEIKIKQYIYVKNEWDKELVLWEYQQNTQTFIQTNQKAEREYPN